MRIWIFIIILLSGCATPAPQKTVSVKSSPVIFSKTLQSVITPQGFITVVPKDVTIQWTASENTDTETVSGYNLYYDTETRFDNDGTWPSNYSNVISVGNTTNVPVTGLRGRTTYYFAATAINQDGVESDFSAESAYTTPLVMDVGFEFYQPVTSITLQWSPDMAQWIDLGVIPTNGVWRLTGDPSVPRFYRAKAMSTQ